MTTCSNWYVYLLRCADNSLYTGVTTDIERRVQEHNHCNKKGAKYTRVRRPVALAYQESAIDRKTACQREYQLKQLTKPEKEQLVSSFKN
ncbi:MAG: GIY-YIG nuclease family protein [Thalassotalea sp.]|nr:GIY-YIG nuclease family protein [Thalassotalea sp.]